MTLCPAESENNTLIKLAASRMCGDGSTSHTLPLCWGNGPRTHWNSFACCVLGRTFKLFSQGQEKQYQTAFPGKKLITV